MGNLETAFFLFLVASYLIGSLNTAKILTKVFGVGGKGDISKLGTGNAGANNAVRQLGVKIGAIVLIGDMGKGALIVFFAKWLEFSDAAALLCALAAMIGHNWPVYFRFKGGKGIAIIGGSLLALYPLGTLIAAVATLPFAFLRMSGLIIVALPIVILVNALLGGLALENIGIGIIAVTAVIFAVIILRRVHAEWTEIKKSPSKVAAVKNIILYDRATSDPPPLNFFRKTP